MTRRWRGAVRYGHDPGTAAHEGGDEQSRMDKPHKYVGAETGGRADGIEGQRQEHHAHRLNSLNPGSTGIRSSNTILSWLAWQDDGMTMRVRDKGRSGLSCRWISIPNSGVPEFTDMDDLATECDRHSAVKTVVYGTG